MKTKQLKQDILNQQKSIGFPKLIYGLLETRNYMHALREYESASSNWRERRVFTFRTTASSPSIAETVPSKRPSL